MNLQQIKKQLKKNLKKLEKTAVKNPFKSLGAILLLLLVVIVLNSYLQQPETAESKTSQPISVQTYAIGETPRITISGTVESANVVTVVAQSSGVVRTVHVLPGQKVYRGSQLVSLSTDYYGNNIPYLQSQLAQKQFETTQDNYDTQIESIELQRELAEKQADNSEELRVITQQSIGETEELLELNEVLLADINSDLNTATDSAVISQLNSQKAQLLSAVNQIRSGLRQTKYQADTDSPVNQLTDISKDLTLKQLDTQKRSLELSLASAELQLKIARAQNALLYPGSPIYGTVDEVLVKENEFVNPGSPLMVLSGSGETVQVVAYVSAEIAAGISQAEPSILQTQNKNIELFPQHVSKSATRGSLHAVTFIIPDEFKDVFTNQSVVSISVPISAADTNAVIPFVPLEALHQSELESIVYVVSEENTVKSRQVQLGEVSGRFVSILDGLNSGDKIILTRSVIEGQPISTN